MGDLDGVLVPEGQFPHFDGKLVQNLKRIVQATGAKIVLSSDWRRQDHSTELARLNLMQHDLDFISETPCLSSSKNLKQRPTEILQWMDEFTKVSFFCGGQREISAWIAIDDR